MREIHIDQITDIIKNMCIDVNYNLSDDMTIALKNARDKESSSLSKDILDVIIENASIAKNGVFPICQDTGMATIFIDVGQEVHFVGGSITEAINKGVAKGYTEGYLRKSIVIDPINRINTKDNTPAVIHYNIVDGDKVNINLMAKGFGSENKSIIKMLPPSAGIEGIKKTVLDCVYNAGASSCPPIVVGIGIGGTMEKCALLAKEALLRKVGSSNKDSYWDSIEKDLLSSMNNFGIATGFGGDTMALAVHINVFATHISSLPVAVNIVCHANRHTSYTL